MSIFGSTFRPFVIRQLETRQALLASEGARPRNVQMYTSGKTAWVKMSSFVNYSAKEGEPADDKLARKYVLMAGTLTPSPTDDKDFGLRGGFATKNGSYGSLGNRQLGYRPMPGITSLNVVNKGAYGSLRLTTVKFKAWDKAQLDDLEILYMRTGYPVLVEWGWSMYMDTSDDTDKVPTKKSDKGQLKPKVTSLVSKDIKAFTSPTINAFDTSKDQDKLYDDILRLNHTFSGNYDGMVGIVQNFTWELMHDGSYDCTTILVSMGDVLDSIKMNRPTNVGNYVGTNPAGYKTGFTQLLEDLLAKEGVADGPRRDSNISFEKSSLAGIVPANSIPNLGLATHERDVILKLKIYESDVDNIDPVISKLEGFTKKVANAPLSDTPAYIQLAYFVAALREGFNLFTDKGTPFLNIELPVHDTKGLYKNKGNGLCLASVDSVSIDPSVCLIKNRNATWITGVKDGFDVGKAVGNTKLISKDFLVEEETNYNSKLGVIGNIYLNLQHLSDKFNGMLKDSKTGEISLYSFIKAIMEDVSKALGSINDFDVFDYDNRVVIIDKHYTELSSNTHSEDKFKLNIYGNNTVTRGFKVLSKIFQSQASMIAISAGADRLNLGGVNSSTQSYFNKGLANRLTGGLTINGSKDSTEEAVKEELRLQALSVLNLREYLKSMISTDIVDRRIPLGEEVVAANTSLNSALLNINVDANYRSIIPLSVEVTLDGIAGIAMGEVFTINTDTLPKEYNRKDLGFIVTALQHNVVKSDWTTVIGAYPILLDQTDDKKTKGTKSLTIANKLSVGEAINVEENADREKWKTFETAYLKLLYFIKYYYENNLNLYAKYEIGTNNPFNVSYTDIRSSINTVTTFDSLDGYNKNTNTIDIIDEVMGVSVMGAPNILLSKYKEYGEFFNFRDTSTANQLSDGQKSFSTPLLNPLLKDTTYNKNVVGLLSDMVNSLNDYKILAGSPETKLLADDVIKWVNLINSKAKVEYLGGRSPAQTIQALTYDPNSSFNKPKWIPGPNTINITYTGIPKK